MIRARRPTEFDLLEIFVDEMQRRGENRNLLSLDIDGSVAARIGSKTGREVLPEEVHGLVNKCLANEWLEHTALGGSNYKRLGLTVSGLGIVRSRQRSDESLAKRPLLKKMSDYIEDHKGLFVAIATATALAGLLITLFRG